MARTVRKVGYFVLHTVNRAGEGAKLLEALKAHGVNLLALSAFPADKGSQVDFVPENSAKLLKLAKALDWKLSPKKTGFLIQGKDRAGALAGPLKKLGKAGINVVAIDAVTSGKKRFGAIFWVKPMDVNRTATLLRAR